MTGGQSQCRRHGFGQLKQSLQVSEVTPGAALAFFRARLTDDIKPWAAELASLRTRIRGRAGRQPETQ